MMAFELEAEPPPQRKKSDLFAKLWLWQVRVLLEKRAGGPALRLFLVLVEEDFKNFGNKIFPVTTRMMQAAKINRHLKAYVLRDLEEWGLIFLHHPGDKKNPQVALRKLNGRGRNPFLE
jgi:hypothetical protein